MLSPILFKATVDLNPESAVRPVTVMEHVPDDILTEIFLHCVDTDVISPFAISFDKTDAWTLARVCRQWRDVALLTPRLWCCIVLPFFPGRIRRNTLAPLQRLQRTLRTTLRRAKLMPLSICLQDPIHRDVLDYLPWSRVRTCVLRDIHLQDFLWILSLLPAETHVSLVDGVKGIFLSRALAPDAVSTRTKITSLSIDSPTFRDDGVLQHLVAPALRKLVINHRNDYDAESHWAQIISLLTRSKSPLTHLRVQSSMGPTMKTEHLLELIESPRGQNLLRLDVYYITDLPAFLRTLADRDEWVPNLRTLALVGAGDLDVMGILAARNPTVRILEFSEWEWDFHEQPVADGLDVVVFRRPYLV